MRSVIVDFARARLAERRGGEAEHVKGKRGALVTDLASARRAGEMLIAALSGAHVEAFGAALRSRLQEGAGSFPMRYLRQFVSEIRFDGARLTMSGKKDALLAAALDKKEGTATVPTSSLSWLLDLGSNQGASCKRRFTCLPDLGRKPGSDHAETRLVEAGRIISRCSGGLDDKHAD